MIDRSQLKIEEITILTDNMMPGSRGAREQYPENRILCIK